MIQIKALTFRYRGAPDDTLRAVDLTVEPGEVFGLLGPSGAGKSTMQRILIGLERGWRGEIAILGAPLGSLGRRYYEQIGVAFETPNLFGKLTALENLEFFATLYARPTEDARTLLERLELGDAAHKRAEALSKGMRMRLNLARALQHRPQLLFLDEPTSGQDPRRVRLIRQLIHELAAGGTTVFLSTHNMTDAAEICSRVGFLINGALPVIDRPDALMQRHGARAALLETETADGVTRASFDLDGLADNASFLSALRAGRVRSLHSQEASLEEVFVAIAAEDRRPSAQKEPEA